MNGFTFIAMVAAAGCAGLSFFFALAETSLFALGKWQARQLAERTPETGRIILGLLAKRQDLLATIVLGNSLANGGIVVLILWPALVKGWPLFGVLGGLFVIILLGAEVLPKTLAVRSPETWSLRVARPIRFCLNVTGPLQHLVRRWNAGLLNWIVPGSVEPHVSLTDEDYEELLDMAYQQGTLDESEKEIIFQIVNLDEQTVSDVMTPRSHIAGISVDAPREGMMAAARRHKHRRLVLYEDSLDGIVGYLNTRVLLLDPEIDLEEATEFPFFVPESMNLLQLLKNMQRQQRELVIVLDEFGGTAGLVTMEDILEEMLGEIRSEGESEGLMMERLGEGRWRVDGTMRLEDFVRECSSLGEVSEVDTLGGLITAQMEVIPKVGDSVKFRGLRLTVLAADERRVREVLVERLKD